MHNALARIQAVFGYFTTCAFALASIIAVLSLLPYPTPTSQPTASISVRNVQVVKGRPHYYSPKREEYAQIRFDLNADLSPLFTWNTKQVFVYVTANYASNPNAGAAGGEAEMSEAVIWDIIIPTTSTPWSYQNIKDTYFTKKSKKSKSRKTSRRDSSSSKTTTATTPGLLSLKNQKPKYQITDPSGSLSHITNATLQVSWNVQPWVGALVWDKGYLGSRVGAWSTMGKAKSGTSKPFGFPAVKGASATVKPNVIPASEKTPEAGEAAPVV